MTWNFEVELASLFAEQRDPDVGFGVSQAEFERLLAEYDKDSPST